MCLFFITKILSSSSNPLFLSGLQFPLAAHTSASGLAFGRHCALYSILLTYLLSYLVTSYLHVLNSLCDERSADGTHIRRSHVLTLLPAAVYNDIQLVPSAMSVILISPGGQLIGRNDSLSIRALPLLESPAELHTP